MPDTTTDPLERAYEHAMAVHREARDRLVALVLARIGRETADAYPTAAELVVEGTYDVEGLNVRADKVLDAAGKVLDGYGPDGESSSDAWDEFCEDMDSINLDVLAGLTYDEYSGTHSIPVPGEPVSPTETSAEALGVAVTITTSAGADGAVLVIVNTTFEPDGSDGGPGLRIVVNDDPAFTGVPWLAPDEED